MNADAFKQCSLPFDGRFFVTHVQRQALARNLSTVHKHGEAGQIVMAQIIRVRISRIEKVGVLYHGEYQAFRESTQHCVIDGYCLGASGIRECLEFDSRQVISSTHCYEAPCYASVLTFDYFLFD